MLEGLEDFLSKLGASTRVTIGVSVSPGVGLEMIEVDRVTKTVSKYASRPLDYNNSTREISDYDQFRDAILEMLDELEIPRKCNIFMSLPNVHFGMINLPILLTDDAVTNAIVSEVEQSYIFKRQEPIVSWDEVFANTSSENRVLAYSAVQKSVLENIQDVCVEIGCNLIGVENSYCSLFKALDYLEVAKEQMRENVSWNLMVVMQNNYSIISMNGKQVVEYYEEPLALKSFVDDEIYNAIKTSAQLTLAGLPANFLYIVSETDLVSAEVLSMGMQSECPIKFLECNKFIQKELLPINLNILQKKGMQITPEAIGVAINTFSDYPLNLNVLKDQEGLVAPETVDIPKVNIGNLEIELTPAFVKKLTIILGVVLLVPTIFVFMFLHNVIKPREQDKADAIKAKVDQLNKQIKQYQVEQQDNTFDVKAVVRNIVSANELKVNYFEALGISIPNKLWVTYYYMGGDGKIDIKGAADDVNSVYAFYKNLKQTVNNSNIRLYKLEIYDGSIDNVVIGNQAIGNTYAFEITNMTDAELVPSPPSSTTTSTSGNPPITPASSTTQSTTTSPMDKKPFFQFGKPLFGSDSQPQQPQQPQQPGPVNPAPGGSVGPMSTPPPVIPSPGPMPQPQGQGNLPPNLRKIEKF